MTSKTQAKITSRERLKAFCDANRGKLKIGFTSGVFDLLHPGHVDYLEKARAQCDLLIVGLNSDSSVKKNKGELRPICSEADRALVLSALSAVDFVFIFDEPNNNLNVSELKPGIYFKAGDYSKDKLTSAPIVEGYGGKAVLIPFKPGHSSSAIISTILNGYGGLEATVMDSPPKERGPAVFLDRDGTIIEHVEYLHEPEKVKLIPGALEAMKKLKDAGFLLIIVTNQPGIGMGYFTKEDFFKTNRELLRAADKAGVKIDKVYFCPHSEADNCNCRKPKPGMLLRGIAEMNVDPGRSFMVGDMTSDVAAGKAAGLKAVLLKSGLAGADGRSTVVPDVHVADIGAACTEIFRVMPAKS